MEIWQVYDVNRQKTKRTMIRGDKFKQGDYHLVIHVCVINDNNQMLIQQRQPFKQGFSNLWDVTVGGSASIGENSTDAAQRELKEEIGLDYDFSNERPFFTVNFEYGFDDYYIIKKDVDVSKLVLQYEEVQAVKWANIDEILTMIDNKEFIPYHKNLIKMIFEMYQNRGSHYY